VFIPQWMGFRPPKHRNDAFSDKTTRLDCAIARGSTSGNVPWSATLPHGALAVIKEALKEALAP
jgi:hypothetical protein